MTKVCNKCGIGKSHNEFYKDKTKPDKLESKCKECSKIKAIAWQNKNPDRKKENQNRWYHNNSGKRKEYMSKASHKHFLSVRLPYWIVYILPNEHYAGVTNCPYKRMSVHKCRQKRDTTGWYEVARFNTEEEALAYEAQLHAQGYKGANPRLRQHKVEA